MSLTTDLMLENGDLTEKLHIGQEFVAVGHDRIILGKTQCFGNNSFFSATVPEWSLGTRFEQGPYDGMNRDAVRACL
jgi:hypothetical protein